MLYSLLSATKICSKIKVTFGLSLVMMPLYILSGGSEAQEFEEGHNFCDPSPCEFEGICRSLVTGYICECPEGTSGYNCEIDIDDCLLHPNSTDETGPIRCQHIDVNATCVDLLNGYQCECSDQFFGDQCEIPIGDREFVDIFPGHNQSNMVELIEMLIQDPSLFQELTPFFLYSDNNGRKEAKENGTLQQQNGTLLSWTLDDMFLWASFAGQELDTDSELVQWHDPLLGNCFTFGQSGKIYDVADVGENYGFQALLQVNEDDYLPWIKSSSINVYVQQRNEHIYASSLHYSVAPGSEAQMMLTQRNVARLGNNYGQCVNRTSDVNTFYYPGIYTVTGCLQSCYQNQVHLVCGCTDPRYLGIVNVTVCGLDKALCVLNVTKNFGDSTTWDSCSNCYDACSESYLDTLWYTAAFPDMPTQCRNLTGDALYSCLNTSNDQALLSVFFKCNVQQNYEDRPSQSFNQWLFQFGGITGIIAGFSFISIIEFIFFLYRTFLTYCTNEAVTQDIRDLQFVDEDDADFDVFIEPTRVTT